MCGVQLQVHTAHRHQAPFTRSLDALAELTHVNAQDFQYRVRVSIYLDVEEIFKPFPVPTAGPHLVIKSTMLQEYNANICFR